MNIAFHPAKLPAGPVSIAFLGVAFARIWLTLVFVEPSAASYATALPHAIFDLGYVALSLSFAFLARHLVPLSNSKRWYILTLCGMMLSSGLSIASMWFRLPEPLCAITAVVGGASYGCFLLLNAEAFAGLSLFRIVLYLSGARALASLCTFILADCGAVRMAAVLVLLPLIAVYLVFVSYHTLPATDRQHAGFPKFQFPWKLICLVAVFSFAYGLRQASLVQGAGQHSSFSTGIVMGVVFLAAYLSADKVDMADLCRLPLPVMASGLLLIPAEGVLGQVASSYLISIGYTLITFLVGVLLYDMSRRTGVPIVPLVAMMNAMQLFVLLGNYTARSIDFFLGKNLVSDVLISVIVCVLLAGSFVLLFSERELASRWGIRALEEASISEGQSTANFLNDRCAELTKTYKLTSREDEILRELAKRKTNQAIAESLVIAPGTLKAHTRHIYEKLGIHTRAELDDILGLAKQEQE